MLNHFSFTRDNHVTQPCMKLMVNTSDCANTMRVKEDQNKHLNGKDFAWCAALSNQRNVGQVVSFGD